MHNVLLIEPSYSARYPPIGLMKLATYHRRRGDRTTFVKLGCDPPPHATPLLAPAYDRIYVSTLFTYEWTRTAQAIDHALTLARGRPERVFVGGIAVTLLHHDFSTQARWQGIRFIPGLLDKPHRQALHLDTTDFDHDGPSTIIDELPPDYRLVNDTPYLYALTDAYIGYATRGCIRRCAFCAVPTLEGGMRDAPPLDELVRRIDADSGPKTHLVLMDNNVTASPTFPRIAAHIRDLGFHKGASRILPATGRRVARRLDFNQGVDARLLVKAPGHVRLLASLALDPLRIAYDHLGLRTTYRQAVSLSAEAGLTSLSAYLLYNFNDSPRDLYTRMRDNIDLNHRLGLRIWSFPMRYQPLDARDRSHVGRHWTPYQLRSMQVLLQATHGVVSGNPGYFTFAFGDSPDAFEHLLGLPWAFLFHRRHYFEQAGRAELDTYLNLRASLSPADHNRLQDFYAGRPLKGITGSALSRLLAYHARRYDPPDKTPPAQFDLPPDDVRIEDPDFSQPPT